MDESLSQKMIIEPRFDDPFIIVRKDSVKKSTSTTIQLPRTASPSRSGRRGLSSRPRSQRTGRRGTGSS
jgi:hypothetical protein